MFDKKGRLMRYMGSMGIKSGAGQRLIVNGFIDRHGFLKGLEPWTGSQLGDSRDVFISGKKQHVDYHQEMNSKYYAVSVYNAMYILYA